MLRFVGKLVDNRRQMLLPEIAAAYSGLVDAQAGRVHAHVTPDGERVGNWHWRGKLEARGKSTRVERLVF